MYLFILRERERERERNRPHGQRESKTERIPSRVCAVSTVPNVGLELMNCEIMIRAEGLTH